MNSGKQIGIFLQFVATQGVDANIEGVTRKEPSLESVRVSLQQGSFTLGKGLFYKKFLERRFIRSLGERFNSIDFYIDINFKLFTSRLGEDFL